MKQPIPTVFTPDNAYALLREVLGSVGVNIQKQRPRLHNILCQTDYLDIIVMPEENEMPMLVIATQNGTYLVLLRFERDGTDMELELTGRTKTSVRKGPRDNSMFNAIALYCRMLPAIDTYIETHFAPLTIHIRRREN